MDGVFSQKMNLIDGVCFIFIVLGDNSRNVELEVLSQHYMMPLVGIISNTILIDWRTFKRALH